MKLFIAVTAVCLADLPVHCPEDTLLGDWEFVLSAPSDVRSSCGHTRPDDGSAPTAGQWAQSGEKVELTLASMNRAMLASGEQVFWTAVSDAGMSLSLPGRELFAFGKFDPLPADVGVGHVPLSLSERHSHCRETSVGWWRSADRTKFGCYVGRRTDKDSTLVSLGEQAEDGLMSAKALDQASMTEQAQEGALLWSSFMQSRVVAAINKRQRLWTASTYASWAGKTDRQLRLMLGSGRARGEPLLLPASWAAAWSHPHRIRRRFAGIASSSELRRGASLDWRMALNGASALDEPMAQFRSDRDEHPCGGCYAIAATRMLSARHRIAQGNASLPGFSISFPMYCSEYTQGCNGGFPFLTAKFGEDVGLLPESCAPYTVSGSCAVSCSKQDVQQRLRAANHRYLTKPGGIAAEDIMEELASGPIAVSFDARQDLKLYKGGVYRSPTSGEELAMVQAAGASSWLPVTHAVLLVGFGTDTKTGADYWLMQNSWGQEWGEQGYFRILREDPSLQGALYVVADVVPDDRPSIMDNMLGWA